MQGKVVIYTSIFGGYDNLIENQVKIPNCDYICFTDHETSSFTWQMNRVPRIYSNSNRNAKKYKILPHRFLKDYEYSIWIDGNILVHSDPSELIKKVLVDSNVAFYSHANNNLDSRNCIYDEARYILEIGDKNYSLNPERGILAYKDNPAIIKNQIQRCRYEGYPEQNGLITGMIIVRRHNELDCINAMEAWWDEIQYNSKRDQLSFNYTAWKHNLNFNYIQGDSRDNEYFRSLGKHSGKQ